MNEEFEELLAKVCDGRASEEERAQLTEILRGDAKARDEYLRYLDLHAALTDEMLPSLESNIINYSPISSGQPVSTDNGFGGTWLKLAAAVAVLLGIVLVWQQPKPETPLIASGEPVDFLPIATLLLADNCQWQGREFVEGQRLLRGRLGLRSGTAVLRLDGGAEVVLTGPVELELESAGSARLHHGDVVVRAEDGAEGFTVHTPNSEVVDLGTEFAVMVAKTGATEVHVLDGEIELRKENAQASVLAAGTAVRVGGEDATVETVKLDAPRFAELIRKVAPKERPDLMTVYDGFHYDAGRYAPSEIVKGKGWAGPWRLRGENERRKAGETDTTEDMHIVHGRLNVVWPVKGGRLGMLEMPAGRSFRVRQMARPIDLSQDGITYFSLMTHEPDHDVRVNGSRPHEGVRLTFRSTDNYWGEALSFGLTHKRQPHVQNGIGAGFKSPMGIADEQSLLWVGKIVSRREGVDEVTFRIYGQNDELDFAEPAEWHVVSRGLDLNTRLNLVLLTSHGQSPRVVDELRIGPTWRSVAPIRKP